MMPLHVSVDMAAMHPSVFKEIIQRAKENANPIKKKYVDKVRGIGVRNYILLLSHYSLLCVKVTILLAGNV